LKSVLYVGCHHANPVIAATEYTLHDVNGGPASIASPLPRTAAPHRGRLPSTEAEVLTGMQGQFWIDTKSYQLIRGVARVLRPVTIGGFLATVQPGTEF